LIIISIAGDITMGAAYPLYYVYTLAIKNKIPCFVTVLCGIVNVLGMYILLTYTSMGLFAVVITTTAVNFAGNLIFTPLYAAYSLGISKWSFYPSLIKNYSVCFVELFVMIIISRIINPISWAGLILGIITCVVCSLIINWFFLLSKKERSKTRSLLFKKVVC
jgi:hypothetical protein